MTNAEQATGKPSWEVMSDPVCRDKLYSEIEPNLSHSISKNS